MGIASTIVRGFERRSLDRANIPITAANVVADLFGSEESASGVRINAETALEYSPIWRAVELVANEVARIPLFVYRRNGEGKDRDPSHPAYRLLLRKPNDEMIAFTWKHLMICHRLLHGNAYSYILRDGMANPLQLIPLDPLKTWPVRVGGRLVYATTDTAGGNMEAISASDMWHMKGPSKDGLAGYGVIEKAKDSLGEGIAKQRYSGRFFKNDASPGVVFEAPGAMPEDSQREFLRQWRELRQGIENSHKAAIMTNGMKINPFTMNAKDAQLIESRAFSIKDASNWTGVPEHKIGGDTRTSHSSLEAENRSFRDEGVNPHLCNLEEESEEKLLREVEKERDTHLIEFQRMALLEADAATVNDVLTSQVDTGLLTPNMANRIMGLPPRADGQGDKYRQPLNIGTVGDPDVERLIEIVTAMIDKKIPADSVKALLKASQPGMSEEEIDGIVDPIADMPEPEPIPSVPMGQLPPPQEETEEDPKEDEEDDEMRSKLLAYQRQQLADSAARMVRRIGRHARKQAKDSHTFLDWIRSIPVEHGGVIASAIRPAVEACCVLGCGGDALESPQRFVSGISERLEEVYNTATPDEFIGKVDEVMSDLEENYPARFVAEVTGE